MRHITHTTTKGAAMMILVFFFVFISLVLLAGIITPSVQEYRTTAADLQTNQAYYLAESGIEDAVYRIRNGKHIDLPATIALDGSNVTTTITDLSSTSKEITSQATVHMYTVTIAAQIVENSSSVWNISSWKKSQ